MSHHQYKRNLAYFDVKVNRFEFQMEENLYMELFKTASLCVKEYLHGPASCNL